MMALRLHSSVAIVRPLVACPGPHTLKRKTYGHSEANTNNWTPARSAERSLEGKLEQ